MLLGADPSAPFRSPSFPPQSLTGPERGFWRGLPWMLGGLASILIFTFCILPAFVSYFYFSWHPTFPSLEPAPFQFSAMLPLVGAWWWSAGSHSPHRIGGWCLPVSHLGAGVQTVTCSRFQSLGSDRCRLSSQTVIPSFWRFPHKWMGRQSMPM